MMPTGPEYVDATLARIESVSAAIGAFAGVEQEWKTEMQARLAAVAELLQGTTDRFFLKTRVCLPFARKCEQAADALGALTADQSGEQQLETALDALEKAARTLDERSMMQGMSIT
jgi:Zn-dependent protease with chaperone function